MFLKFFVPLIIIGGVHCQNEVSQGVSQLMRDILHNLETDKPSDNFVISPLSLHSTFSQALIGAGGRTQAELEGALGVTRSRSLADQYSNIHTNIASLNIANILALNTGFQPKQNFIKFLEDSFGTNVKEFDFHDEKDKSVKEINDVVASHTKERITDLITAADVDTNLRMMLINAVYFKAKWKQEFNPENSFMSNFQSPKLGNVMTEYMTGEMDVRLDETDKFDILELPYDDESKSMLIFLPKEEQTTTNHVNSIHNYPTNAIKQIPKTQVSVSIPKFDIDFQMDLVSNMNRLGVWNMFSDAANFSYITDKPMRVSDGIHKAFIEVNEEGTEAAAATAVLISFKSGALTKRFFASKPFYFMVYDFVLQVPLFTGKLSNPTEAIGTPIKSINDQEETASKNSLQTNEIPQSITEDCQPYLEHFGTAVHNNAECKDKRSKPYQWFVENHTACLESQKLYRNFIARNCGDSWCEYGRQNYKDWKEKFGKSCLENSESIECLMLEFNLKAKTYLSCKF